VIAALLLVGLLGLLLVPDIRGAVTFRLEQLLDYTEHAGPWGYAIVVGVYIVACVLMLPGSVITLGAGAALGFWKGVIAVSAGSTLGASVAFLVGRTIARRWIEKKVASNAKFRAIDVAVGRQGFKIVLLTRLSPIFPFNLQNYMYGLTKVRFWKYVLASWIGMLPGTALYVYIGYVGRVAAEAATKSGGGETDTLRYVLTGVGLLATIVVTIVITRVARRALKQTVQEPRAAGETP